MRRLLLLMLAICTLASCSKDPGDETPPNIEVTAGTTTQEVFADNTQCSEGVKFTTTGAWSSSIVSTTKADAPDWLSIDPASGDKAGNYTINIILTPNYTGENRNAEIKISCGGTVITITVEQKGITEDGEKPKPQKLVSKIISRPDFKDDISKIEFTYYPDNKVKTIVRSEKGSDITTTHTYTYSGTKITEITKDQLAVYETIYTLNNDGYIIDYTDDGKEKGTFTYSNGYLTEIIYKNADKDKYVWESGNLKSAQAFYFDSNTTIGTLYTYQYGTELNNCSGNIDIVRIFIDGPDFLAFDYCGKRTKNLPTQQIGSDDDWGKDNGTTTYRYQKDKDGCIIKIYATNHWVGEEVEPEILDYEIQYK